MRPTNLLSYLLIVALTGAAALEGGCSSPIHQSSPPPVQAGTSQVSFTVRDAPPTGVTVVSFKIDIVGAALQSNSGNVSLLNGSEPAEIELTKLETESALLGTSQVPAGTYTGLQITLANPDLTVFNNSGAAIGSCANNSACEFKPAASGSVTFTAPPFPLTLSANSSSALQLDVNLNNIINSDFSLNLTGANILTVTQVAVAPGDQENETDVSGQIKSIGTNQFVLQDSSSAMMVTITVNSQTVYKEFDEAGCQAANFSCLAPGQTVEVEQTLQSDGTLVASRVGLKESEHGEEVEGSIVSLSGNPPTQLQMVVLDEVPNITGVSVGNSVTVNIQNGASFQMDSSEAPIPNGLSFASAADLLVGQEIHVRPDSVTAGPPISISTSSIRLTETELTASVKSVNGSLIKLQNLPAQFGMAGITEIQVQTSQQTEFENISGAGALNPGDLISVRGLLFKATPPALAAEKVRKR
jgi:hypothetical protein